MKPLPLFEIPAELLNVQGVPAGAYWKLPFPKAGDLVLFPRHVGVVTVDRGTKGVLDDQDLMMHALFDTPKEQPIADSGYADEPLEVRRF